jgi:hypothetical protein
MKRHRSLILAAYTTALATVLLLTPGPRLDAMESQYRCHNGQPGESTSCIEGILLHQHSCDPMTEAMFCAFDEIDCPGGVKLYCGGIS